MFCATGRQGPRNKGVPAACPSPQGMVSTQETFKSFGWDWDSWVQRVTELCRACLPSLLLTPEHWLKTDAVLFSIKYYMNIKKERRLQYIGVHKQFPIIQTEFQFQDLLMTLSYSGCTPEGTEERWKTRQHVVRLNICNLNCFQVLSRY